ncbi:hypothetical protein [Alicyclobacillus ferrooxydans]|uniref:Uncharacterized protein n=1 Tax=Alicyclobacillus ferrooxydans TaxID=471514 RepID=A0A0P9C9T6_9BACL|nr:hypothetical protein [Alicyclobacillus ferrooxydans]KPV42146.1 hypothetical protein AN477_19045 [Alicyclobacillus ferrooxydans]
MPARAEDIHSYYLILLDFLLFVGFVIVLKVVMLLLMAKLSISLSDNPEEAQQAKVLHKQKTTFDQTLGQKWLRLGMGTLITISGILQIQPRMVDISKAAVMRDLGLNQAPGAIHALASPFVNLWAANSAWMNVLSCTVQLLVGLVLLTTANRTAVRITAVAGGLFAVFDWVLMTGFGGLFVPNTSLSGGSPLLEVVYLLMLLMFVLPASAWQIAERTDSGNRTLAVRAKRSGDVASIAGRAPQNARAYTYLRIGIIGFWLLQVVFHVLPMEGFWTSSGWNRFLSLTNNGTVPGWVANTSDHVAHIISPGGLIVNVVAVVLFLAFMAVEWFLTPVRFATVIRVISIVWLVLTWFGFDHFGFQPVYMFSFGTSPAIVLALFILMIGPKQAKEHKDTQTAHGARLSATGSRTV